MDRIVIVHGPPRSGKTINAERLRAKFNCTRIVDDWYPLMRNATKLKPGDLVLTNCGPHLLTVKGALIIGIDEALK